MGMLIQRIGAAVDVSFRKNILECCVSKALNPRRLRFIQNTFGSRVAADCISIQTWVTSHDQTFAAARMITRMLGEQGAADEVRNQPQTLEMVAAYLKDRMKLSKDFDADTAVRSAVSIFSPPLAMLIIGEGCSEYVVLCKPERNQQSHFESTSTLQAAESCVAHALASEPLEALGHTHAGSKTTVGSPHLFRALAFKLPGVRATAHAEKVADDVMDVVREHPTLVARVESFWRDDGQEELRICLKGSVGATYKGQLYQAPIIVWLSDRYPDTPPDLYVDVPAAPKNVIVPMDHAFVSPDGKVRGIPAIFSPPFILKLRAPGASSAAANVGSRGSKRHQVLDSTTPLHKPRNLY